MLDLKKDNVGSKIIRFPQKKDFQKKDFQRKDFKRQSSIIAVVKHRQKVYNNYRESDILSNGGTVIMDRMQEDVAVIKNDIGYLKEDIKELKSNVNEINTKKLPEININLGKLDVKFWIVIILLAGILTTAIVNSF